MKKTWKKLTALAVAMMMVLAMSVTVYADDPEPTPTPTPVPTSQTIDTNTAADAQGQYTISVATDDTHTYKVYQILKGTLVAGEKKLGNPEWGEDAAATTTYATVDAFLTAITAPGLSNQQVNAIAESVKSPTASAETVEKDHALKVDPGYYLIVDETAALKDGDTKSLNIVAVFNNITITPKKGTVESEKHVDDVNDSDSTDHSELRDSADYDIGDSIKYTLTMKLPADYANYKQYHIAFIDDMSAGLTYNGDATIYYGAADTTGTDIGTAFTVDTDATSAYSTPSAGKVYKYTIADLKASTATAAQKALVAGDVIKIEYTATLNNSAVIGYAGNPNQYRIDFSSNPNQDAGGTPETNDTPWDKNIVFTYKTVFNKVDENGDPLTGADFTLYKFVESATGAETYGTKKGTWTDVTRLGDGTNKPSKEKDELTIGEGTDAKTAANAKFTFSGLDAGVYKLVESTTPTGYNTLPEQVFTITAEHELEADDPKLTDLSGTDGAQFNMTPVKTTETPQQFTGELDADIENKQGTELPSTGGIGTTIFYVLGAILVLGGTVVLVTRRRMAA